ncbi:hypothetical protein D3C81_1955230 [compost metagenome]
MVVGLMPYLKASFCTVRAASSDGVVLLMGVSIWCEKMKDSSARLSTNPGLPIHLVESVSSFSETA